MTKLWLNPQGVWEKVELPKFALEEVWNAAYFNIEFGHKGLPRPYDIGWIETLFGGEGYFAVCPHIEIDCHRPQLNSER